MSPAPSKPVAARPAEPYTSIADRLDRVRIVTWCETRRRWCVCNGFADILATAATKEEAEALASQPLQACQLDFEL